MSIETKNLTANQVNAMTAFNQKLPRQHGRFNPR